MEKKKPANLILSAKIPRKLANNKKEPENTKEWKTVFSGCCHVFNGKKLSSGEYTKVYESIHAMTNSETGTSSLVSHYYEDPILRRGMEILREEIKEKPGHNYLVKLGDMWMNFYQNILPTLQALFCNVSTHKHSIRVMTLLAFRNLVILQLKVDEALTANNHSVPKSLKNMFCILLQSVHDNTEQYVKLEMLAARVLNPLLGSKGLYTRSEVKELKECKHSDRYSLALTHSNSGFNSEDHSPEISVKPVSYTEKDDADSEFEDLMNYRRQKYTRYPPPGPQRLSRVEETAMSESLASLIAEGFEIGE